METLHKSDCGLHNEPAFKQTNCDCGAIDKPYVEFETENQLSHFREIENQHFDQYNQHYRGQQIGHETAQQMLALINQLEKEVKNHCQFYTY